MPNGATARLAGSLMLPPALSRPSRRCYRSVESIEQRREQVRNYKVCYEGFSESEECSG